MSVDCVKLALGSVVLGIWLGITPLARSAEYSGHHTILGITPRLLVPVKFCPLLTPTPTPAQHSTMFERLVGRPSTSGREKRERGPGGMGRRQVLLRIL